MYWDSSDYEAMSKMVIDVYLDYGIRTFPVDEKEICRKLGVKLLPYSDFPDFVKDVSDDAFYVPPTTEIHQSFSIMTWTRMRVDADIMFFMS